jgi:hypothetical protein
VTSTASLTLTRTSDEDAKQRQVYVSLDGEQVAYMMFGDSKTVSIAPGKHTLKANNTLVWKTVHFEAQPGEEVRFSLVNYPGRGFALLLALFGASVLFLRIDRA